LEQFRECLFLFRNVGYLLAAFSELCGFYIQMKSSNKRACSKKFENIHKYDLRTFRDIFFSQCSNLFADYSELCFYIKMKSSDRPACRKFENILKICHPHCSKVVFFAKHATIIVRMDSILTKKESVQYFRARSAQSLARLLAGATTLKSVRVGKG
jgi:hypothetical protein